MLKNIKIWCNAGVLTCKNVDLKFTEQGIMLEGSVEDVFVPYGSLHLARCKKTKGRGCNMKLHKYSNGEHDCV